MNTDRYLARRPRSLSAAVSLLSCLLALLCIPAFSAGAATTSHLRSHAGASARSHPVSARPTRFGNSPISTDEWYQVTLVDHPVGYLHDSYRPYTWHGIQGWKFEEVFHLFLTKDANFTSTTTHYTRMDGADLETVAIREDPSGRSTLRATYPPGAVDCVITTPGSDPNASSTIIKKVHLKLGPGVVLAPQTPYEIPPADVKVNKVIGQWSLDTDKAKVQKEVATVEPSEMIDLPGRGPVEAWKLRIHTIGETDDYFVWVDRNGEGVKLALPIQGLDLIGLLVPYAPGQTNAPGPALWKAGHNGTVPASPAVKLPREVNVMDLSMTGVPASLQLPSDGVQRVVRSETGVLHVSVGMLGMPGLEAEGASTAIISAGPPGSDTGIAIITPSVTGSAPLTDVEKTRYLSSAGLVDSASPAIVNRARDLTQLAHSPVQKCMILRDWVNAQMRLDEKAPANRTASQLLQKKSGVCRDYAVLYAALARAAGVPTRACGGMIYDSGEFWGHAWCESWVGYWLPIDPCMEGHFVDAMHVKLAEGDAPEVFTRAGADIVGMAGAHTTLTIDWVQPTGAR